MYPILSDGDYVVVREISHTKKIKIGEIVEICHPDYGSIIKIVDSIHDKYIRVRGAANQSSDSDQIGRIINSRVISQAIWKIGSRGLSRL
tara:strand:- start:81 stop:350 length:270 start_codon:yes stop_codon:yes gene_type:complete